MSQSSKTKIVVSPWTVLLLAVFVAVSSPLLLVALLTAALCHELGHYYLLRAFGAEVDTVYINAFGAELRLSDRMPLSYGREILAVAAGPAANLVLFTVLSLCGRQIPVFYVFSGAQLVLAVFNLLPVRPLDGGTLVWLCLAWWINPFAADSGARWIGGTAAAALLLFSLWLLVKSGNPFLLFGVAGLGKSVWMEKGLVKRKKNR